MTDTTKSENDSSKNTNSGHSHRSKLSEAIHCPPDGGLREDYVTGLAGNNLSQLFVGLQSHKQQMELAKKWAERANRIGWQNAGIDVAKVDAEMKAADEDVDSSINLSGDTHIHMGPNQPSVSPQQPQKPPAQPQQPVQGRVPTWAKWLLGAAVAGNAVGIPAAAYFASRDSTTIVNPPDRSTIGLTIE